MHLLDHILRAVGMCVRNKELTELLLVNQPNDLRHPLLIEFVKNVVQQQDRIHLGQLLEKIELGQF